MLTRIRKAVTVLALYAIALHVILLGMVPPGTIAALDAISVICHTTGPAAAPGEPPAGTLKFIPGRAIDHCDLCSAAAPPPAPDAATAIDYQSTRVLHIFRPTSTPALRYITSNPKLARGPPSIA
jgi:hypothetical protein